MTTTPTVAIIGAGPAGLTAAYLLCKGGATVTVLEADPVYVGGISRTARYKGYHFDIGGHRFFSKSKEVEDFWTEILPDDMLHRPRSSRIFYNGKFFAYPLKAAEALFKLGVFEATRCVLSYMKARMFPVKEPRNFEDWVTNQFGSRLFNIFFKTYTEKVWGMSCKEISADWAAQRIKGLSLKTAILNAIWKPKPKNKGEVIKTLIDSFRYPRKGPGMMWEACAEKVKQMGGAIHMGCKVVGCHWDADAGLWHVAYEDAEKRRFVTQAQHVISSAPMRQLVKGVTPAVSDDGARRRPTRCKYRDFLTVMLILKDKNVFTDNWIYIHDPSVKVGRVQNFKSWSPEMVAGPVDELLRPGILLLRGRRPVVVHRTSELIEQAKRELEKIGLGKATDVVDGCVVRQPKAYPVYDDDYAKHVATISDELEAKYPTLHLVGRNGMHKYNNQDHAMMTAMLCVQNILAERKIYDLWQVNQDAEYHESGAAGREQTTGATGLRMVPTRVKEEEPAAVS